MKKIILMTLLMTVTLNGMCQMSQTVMVDGSSNGKFVTRMTFSGDNVNMTYENGSETKDMSLVGVDFDYAVSLSQSDSQGNADKLAIYGGRVMDVNVARTVSANYWAPVCFPFSMSATQIATAFGDGVKVTKLTKATTSSINFSIVNSITAGEPYLIKLPAGSSNVTSFSLQDVALNNFTAGARVEGDAYTFVGTIPEETLNGDNYYYFTTSNTMRPLIRGNKILAMRGYMEADSSTPAATELLFVIDDMITGIMHIDADGMQVTEGDVYTIGGQRIGSSRERLQKGIYIVNGKKIVVK